MRQPYIYTMPEAFIYDDAVPSHWKLYALINGFWISGSVVFGGNTWFSKKIKCSERQVRRSLEKLENLGLIFREIHGFRRVIHPRGGHPTSAFGIGKADAGRPHNSVSISSESKKTSSTFPPLRGQIKQRSMDYVPIDDDGRELSSKKAGPKPEGKNKVALRLLSKFSTLCVKVLDVAPVRDVKGYKMCIYAMNAGGLTEAQIEDLFDEWFKLGKPDEETVSITRALSARHIEGYKVRNGVK